MAKCKLTGKSWMNGNKISHSNVKSKKKFKPNIQKKKIFNDKTGKFITIKICMKALRSIDKIGISKLLIKHTNIKH